MSDSPRRVSLERLTGIFNQVPEDLGRFEAVAGPAVPEPYRSLLVHQHHMTVTVERHHGQPVTLRVLDRRQQDDSYARKILLCLQSTGRVVQFGIMRFDFRHCTAEIRDAILDGTIPLGRILIEHNVLTSITPEEFVRVVPAAELMRHFGLSKPVATYGRLATIACNGESAVDLLEVVAPEPSVPV